MIEFKHIAQLEIFSVFSKAQLDKLSEVIEVKSFKKGDHIYAKGDEAGEMFIVFKGAVSLREIEPGSEIGIAFEQREKGDFFGSAAFLEPNVYTLTAVCLTDTEVLVINADHLHSLFRDDTALGYTFMKKVAQIYFMRYKNTKGQICQMVRTPEVITALPG